MTPDDDRGFLTDGRPYLNARQAALYCGFEPASPGTLHDPQIKLFQTWASRRGIRHTPGRAVYRRADLDAAIAGNPIATTSADVEAGRRLAREDVAEFRRRARSAARNR